MVLRTMAKFYLSAIVRILSMIWGAFSAFDIRKLDEARGKRKAWSVREDILAAGRVEAIKSLLSRLPCFLQSGGTWCTV